MGRNWMLCLLAGAILVGLVISGPGAVMVGCGRTGDSASVSEPTSATAVQLLAEKLREFATSVEATYGPVAEYHF